MSRQASPNSLTPRRVTLALLVLPPLIALALLAYATLLHQPRPVHTGDALLDAYLQALVDTGVAGSMESFSLFSNKDALPPALVEGVGAAVRQGSALLDAVLLRAAL